MTVEVVGASRCLDHFKKLSPKALKTLQIWNEEAIQFQG
uniref:Uncharacterized protein n=1 Tax=Curvibacter symbiont subsp. Hydra magnipapillata TaxID=667019 RepID=C9YFF8_CURXX|nr:hypothetical protein Csp_D33140 [Curvibacter putative symbiont of Hydra magnipapillata]